MSSSLPWSQTKEEQPPLLHTTETGKVSPSHKEKEDLDQAVKKPRQKQVKDVGSRWIAPILLIITIVISLLLKLLNRQ